MKQDLQGKAQNDINCSTPAFDWATFLSRLRGQIVSDAPEAKSKAVRMIDSRCVALQKEKSNDKS